MAGREMLIQFELGNFRSLICRPYQMCTSASTISSNMWVYIIIKEPQKNLPVSLSIGISAHSSLDTSFGESSFGCFGNTVEKNVSQSEGKWNSVLFIASKNTECSRISVRNHAIIIHTMPSFKSRSAFNFSVSSVFKPVPETVASFDDAGSAGGKV